MKVRAVKITYLVIMRRVFSFRDRKLIIKTDRKTQMGSMKFS